MAGLALIDLRACLEGGFPALIATCAADGTPNVSALSDVRYIDERHIALSFQFFNKTRANILANPVARLQLTDPRDGARYLLGIRYLRTETSGPLFAAMRAKLAGIAFHSGMSKVFVLRGADIYVVDDIEQSSGPRAPLRGPSRLLAGLRDSLTRLAATPDLPRWVDASIDALSRGLGFAHCLLLLADEPHARLYTVASHGYERLGVGSEIAYGEGVIGIAAEQRTAIRLTHMAQDYQYGEAVRAAYLARHPGSDIESRIALPGLDRSGSQLALPVIAGERLVAVLYVESAEDGDIDHDDEDALTLLAEACARAFGAFSEGDEADEASTVDTRAPLAGPAMLVSHDEDDHSVFVDDEYLIKGVAGAILWRMLRDYVELGRVEFNNKDLRRDRALGLPDVGDNLEARLVLLQRRLRERLPDLALDKTGRGRYQLRVARPLRLATPRG
jgi:adenylate cyclase